MCGEGSGRLHGVRKCVGMRGEEWGRCRECVRVC